MKNCIQASYHSGKLMQWIHLGYFRNVLRVGLVKTFVYCFENLKFCSKSLCIYAQNFPFTLSEKKCPQFFFFCSEYISDIFINASARALWRLLSTVFKIQNFAPNHCELTWKNFLMPLVKWNVHYFFSHWYHFFILFSFFLSVYKLSLSFFYFSSFFVCLFHLVLLEYYRFFPSICLPSLTDPHLNPFPYSFMLMLVLIYFFLFF